jgi:alcohol dehydrogenase class IV
LNKKLGIPSLRAVSRMDDEEKALLAKLASEHPCSPSNSRSIDFEDYLRILSDAYADRVPISP